MDLLPPLAVVGAGSMGGAIVRGLVASGADPARIAVSTRSSASAASWREAGVRAISVEEEPAASAAVVEGTGVVLLGVEPSSIAESLRSIAPALDPVAIVVSVAAGVSCAAMEAIVPNPVVRAMPNTPALVRRAVTGIVAGSRAHEPQLAIVRRLFEAVGVVVEIPETSIDALATISGSGPATVCFLMEQLTETARRLGFADAEARVLVEQTFLGATALLEASGETPAQLRERVTSPGGMTERVVAVLEEADLPAVFDRAAAAAIARSKELGAD